MSWVSGPGGRGYVNDAGVTHHSRGHGYCRQLLAIATRALIDEGASTLVADADVTNVPMVQAFRAVGWPRSEKRIDFLLS